MCRCNDGPVPRHGGFLSERLVSLEQMQHRAGLQIGPRSKLVYKRICDIEVSLPAVEDKPRALCVYHLNSGR